MASGNGGMLGEAGLVERSRIVMEKPFGVDRASAVSLNSQLHKIFSEPATMAKVNEGCRSAGIGCIECKSWAADALVSILNPMQERRKKYEDNPRLAWDILEAGSAKARKVAEATLREARDAMGMSLEYKAPRGT